MAKKLSSNHYLASPASSPQPGYVQHRGGYWTDGEDSQRAPSDRTTNMSEYYMVANERAQVIPKASERKSRSHQKRSQALHASSPNLRAPSQISYDKRSASGVRAASVASNFSDKRSKRGGSVGVHGSSSHLREPTHFNDDGSDVYVTSGAYRAPSEISRGSRYSRNARGAPSQYSYRSGAAPSEMSTVKTKNSRKGGVVVETMSAPNPFCPNTKGLCCLLLLINLGLILITLGFVIVMQFYEPLFVWILGIVFLVFGFIALNVSLIYCVSVCKDMKSPKQVAMEDHYWTHHWQKNFSLPEIHYKSEEKFPESDRYSDRYSISKYSAKYSDKAHQRY
ncbi:UNVERIFIED_CONTAM: hypothetical protein PYX00_007874 [Menopon gallinae]|uniref:Uncharacterized protein n=1 Tax=Menopon gallinae TaxID=328185 RepID=A0AAW2HKR1_9NEOP